MLVLAEIATSPSEKTGLPIEAVIKEGEAYFGFLVNEGALQKQLLINADATGDFVTFEPFAQTEMVTAGAYYIE
mgnify:CR=1 FL=1